MGIWPFGGGGAGAPPRNVKGAPSDRVRQLSSQGLSEPEIIRALKDEGFSPIQVDSAMRSVLKDSIGGPGDMPRLSGPPGRDYPQPPPETKEEFERPGPSEPDKFEDMGEPPKPPLGDENMGNEPLNMARFPGEEAPAFTPEESETAPEPPPKKEKPPFLRDDSGDVDIEPLRTFDRGGIRESREERRRVIEELIESVVDEKWNQFRGEIGEIQDKFHQVDTKIMDIEQVLGTIKGEKKTEIEEIETKIDSYKQSISEISERMQSVEQAMKDSLTPMLQSLRSLSDTIKTLKEQKG